MDVVDAFVVTLGLDPRNYQREIKGYRDDRKRLAEEDAKYNRSSEDAQKRMASGIRTLRNETAGFLFMLAGANGVKDFAANILTGDAATGRLARNLGIATERVSAWEGVIKRVGGSAQDIQGALRSMSSAFQSLQLTGSTGHDADFQGLGVNARDLQNPEGALLKISEASSRMGRPEFNARLSRLGFDQNTINLLAKGRVEVSRLLEEQRKLGVATDADAKAAQDFEAAWAKITTSIQGAARPWIEKLAGSVAGLTDNTEKVKVFGDIAVGAIAAIGIAAAASYAPIVLLAGAIAGVLRLRQLLNDATPEQRKAWEDDARSGYKSVMSHLARGDLSGALDVFKSQAAKGWDIMAGNSPTPGSGPGAAGSRDGNPARVPAGQRAVALHGNNPGGINDGAFARRQPGYAGANGRYAAFNTMADGIAAQRALLASYVQRGYDTPAKIASRWAPAGDGGNNPNAYASNIARQMGIGVNDRIGSAQLNAFQHAQAITENHTYGRARPGLTAGGGAAGLKARLSSAGVKSETNINGDIIIHTQATDAKGIARDMHGALSQRGMVNQANTGLQP